MMESFLREMDKVPNNFCRIFLIEHIAQSLQQYLFSHEPHQSLVGEFFAPKKPHPSSQKYDNSRKKSPQFISRSARFF